MAKGEVHVKAARATREAERRTVLGYLARRGWVLSRVVFDDLAARIGNKERVRKVVDALVYHFGLVQRRGQGQAAEIAITETGRAFLAAPEGQAAT